MIYTLTLNPAIDYILEVPALMHGETLRASSARVCPGGKGVNVSLMLRQLDCPTVPLGICAGLTGGLLLQSLTDAGLAPDFVHLSPACGAEGWTRVNVKVSAAEGDELEINAAGAPLPEAAWDDLTARLAARLAPGDTLVTAGSLPKGCPGTAYADLLCRLAASGVDLSRIRLAADTTGERLRALLPLRPFVVKPNRAELSELTGLPCAADDAALLTASRRLQTAGARNVLVSLGGDGAMLLTEDGTALRIGALPRPADAPVGNTTGAGDSMLAGFLCACERGMTPPDCLRFATACGAATAFSIGGIADRAAAAAAWERTRAMEIRAV